MALLLEITPPDAPPWSSPLSTRPLLAGRHAKADLLLDGPGVPAEAVRLVPEGDRVLAYNLDPGGGLLLNGRVFESSVLSPGDALTVAGYKVALVQPEARFGFSTPDALKLHLHEQLIARLDLRKVRLEEMRDAELRSRCDAILRDIVATLPGVGEEEGARLRNEVLNEALGLGPLEALLADESITEIMVNSRDRIYVERRGKLELTPLSVSSDEQLVNIIARIVNPLGRRVDESTPMVDARLADGSRFNAIIPPLSLRGPMITIRKFGKKVFTADDYIRFGSATAEVLGFLKACVEVRKNVVISGGTGSGKTSLLNCLSSFIPKGERVLTIEDSAELKLPHPNIGSLEARPANIEGRGAVTIRDLVKNALRMRPDRIVVGECRSGEALDMLQAMNTGHDGSLTTLHANNPQDAALRLETMVMMAGFELPSLVIRQQIASAVHVIVQQTRLSDGSRKIVAVSEVSGMEGSSLLIHDLFVFRRESVDGDGTVRGTFVATGRKPTFLGEFAATGIRVDPVLFTAGRTLQ